MRENNARSLLKESKFYFYDHAYIHDNKGAHLENLVACALLKELQFIEDSLGLQCTLNYLRTKDGKELDFIICIDQKITLLLEVKWSDDTLSNGFSHFGQFLPGVKKIQIVKELAREKTYPGGEEIRALIPWLTNLSLGAYSGPT